MRTIDRLLSEYGESHQNPFNKKIHWVCVPLIFWTVVALLWSIKIPQVEIAETGMPLNGAMIATLLVIGYYITLSIPLSLGMMFYTVLCLFTSFWVEKTEIAPLWAIALGLFVIAWIFQFYGHKVEGKKPSFLKDLQFLLIGPAWLMHFIYKKAGIAY